MGMRSDYCAVADLGDEFIDQLGHGSELER